MHDKLLSSKKHQQEFKYIYSIIIIAVHLVVCNQGRRNALKHRLAQNFKRPQEATDTAKFSWVLASQVPPSLYVIIL